MADNGANPRGPRCIALVGPFQSGKTTLLEAMLARTNAIQRQGTVDAGTTVGDASKEARHHKMSVEVTVATTQFHGRRLYVRRLSGFGRIRPRDARRAAGGRRRRGGVRGGRAQGVAAPARAARAGRPEDSRAFCSSTRSTRPTSACARRSSCCSRRRACRCCCARFRSGRTRSSPVSSISRSSAPSSTASMCRPRWCRSTATT